MMSQGNIRHSTKKIYKLLCFNIGTYSKIVLKNKKYVKVLHINILIFILKF